MNQATLTNLCANCCEEKLGFEPDMGSSLDWKQGICQGCNDIAIVFSENE